MITLLISELLIIRLLSNFCDVWLISVLLQCWSFLEIILKYFEEIKEFIFTQHLRAT